MEPCFNTPHKSSRPLAFSPSPHSLHHSPITQQYHTTTTTTTTIASTTMLNATLTSTNSSPMMQQPPPLVHSRSSPSTAVHDRYIAARASQDNSISHFLLTSKENMTPLMKMSRQGPQQVQHALQFSSPPREDSLASSLSVRQGSPAPGPWSPSPQQQAPSPFDSSSRRAGAGGHATAAASASSASRAASPAARVSDVFAKLRLDSASMDRRVSQSPLGPHEGSPQSPSVQHPLFSGSPAATAVMEVEPYACKLARALFSEAPQTSVLGLHAATGAEEPNASVREEDKFSSSLGVVFESNRARHFQSKTFRVIAQTPERILDAADMLDDFYLNLLDWSSTGLLSVALQSVVYLWDARTCNITQLPPSSSSSSGEDGSSGGPAQLVCSVNWHPDGQHLAVGSQDGSVAVWDVETQKVVRRWRQHSHRVGSLAWAAPGGAILATGGKDAAIHLHDLRESSEPTPVSPLSGGSVATLKSHEQEVCGLRWAANGVHLASGGNDNQLMIWDRRMVSAYASSPPPSSSSSSLGMKNSYSLHTHQYRATRPLLYLSGHTAAVKALAWNPSQPSLLASGGGTDDKSLRFWNTSTGECLHQLNTQSQVCGVLWNSTGTELISSHGYSLNQLTIWKYPSLRRVADLTGHTSRVLHLCKSPDGEVVASAAGDETIRFWRCFPPHETDSGQSHHIHAGASVAAGGSGGSGSGGSGARGRGGGAHEASSYMFSPRSMTSVSPVSAHRAAHEHILARSSARFSPSSRLAASNYVDPMMLDSLR